ncbi:MAG TPA: glutaredoxin family protein [Nitrolancea sp.]|nr:glutaredoxin family protein [Nitrolancea sp.]
MDQPQVTLYTQAGCVESAQVRTWLQRHGVPFHERNVSADPDAARALAETGIFATPLLVVGGYKILGFRPAEIEEALRASGVI